MLDDKAMPRSRQERQVISATCPPRTLVVTPHRSLLFLRTPGLDHQVYQSSSSNPLEHLTETLETSQLRLLSRASPHRRHLVWRPFRSSGKQHPGSKCGERSGQEGATFRHLFIVMLRSWPPEQKGYRIGLSPHSRRLDKGPRHRLGQYTSQEKNEGKTFLRGPR